MTLICTVYFTKSLLKKKYLGSVSTVFSQMYHFQCYEELQSQWLPYRASLLLVKKLIWSLK
jgi:hypothetical protein